MNAMKKNSGQLGFWTGSTEPASEMSANLYTLLMATYRRGEKKLARTTNTN